MKRITITGAQGFIGNQLVDYFKDKGYETVGWGRRKSQFEETCLKQVDMSNSVEIENALKEDSPDIIIHCAGCANVGESIRFPQKDFTGNVVLTHNLFFALHKLKMEKTRVVYLSSAAVYGNPQTLPIREDMESNPLSPYAMHKKMGEDICNYFRKNYGMDIKIARIFSAYGRGLKKQIFWDMHQKYMKTQKLEMFGSGMESRDYIHIDDLARALYLIATCDSPHTIYNVANGKDVTIRHATECFAKCADIPKEKISFNGVVREGDPLNWRADISRLEELGYIQEMSLHEGISDYIGWVRQYENHRKSVGKDI